VEVLESISPSDLSSQRLHVSPGMELVSPVYGASVKELTLQVSTSSYPVCQRPRGVSIGCTPNETIRHTLAKKMNIVRVRCKVKIIAK